MTQNSRILSFDKARKDASRRRASSDLYAGLDYYGERYGASSSLRGGTPIRLAGASRDAVPRLAQSTRGGRMKEDSGKAKDFDLNIRRGGKPSFAESSRLVGSGRTSAKNARSEEGDFELSAKEQRARNREQVKRSRAKAKAEKAFSRQYGGSNSNAASESGPRAAVYKGQMGADHKRAARLQTSDANARKNFGFAPIAMIGALLGSVHAWLVKPRSAVAASVAICLVLTAGFLYPSARTYYQAVREEARLEIEYAALEERNQALSQSVSYMQTDAGIESRARSQYGWVKEGEHAATVSGVDAVEEDANISAKVMSDEIKPPATWYSAVLDPLFGVES